MKEKELVFMLEKEYKIKVPSELNIENLIKIFSINILALIVEFKKNSM